MIATLSSFVVRVSVVLGCVLIPGALFAQQGLNVTYGSKGVQTLSYQGSTLADVDAHPADQFHIFHMKVTDLNGNTNNCSQCNWGESNNGESWDANTHTETYSFSWGKIAVQFSQSGNNLNMLVTETNNAGSGLILDGAEIYPFALHFPQDPINFNGYTQYALTSNGPGVTPADYGSGIATVVQTNAALNLYTGWKRVDAATYSPMMTGTEPDGFPTFAPVSDLPVRPGTSVSYTISVRFTPEGTPASAADAYASYATTYPSQLAWTDRRIIGTVYLSSSPVGTVNEPGGYPTNPRRYFNDPSINITTPSGLQSFQERILTQAASQVTNARTMDSQGVITWDIEGEQYPQSTSYVCSPDQIATVAPEMESTVTDPASPYKGQKLDDAYFKIMSSAGLRVGVCLRPQVFTFGPNNTATQNFLSTNSDIIANLEKKARFANSRWGTTLFYVDSTVDPNGGTLDPAIFQQLITDLPNFLFIPEESTPRYYAYSAPFYSFIFHGTTGTPASTYQFYPKAFGANLINDVNPEALAAAEPQLIQSVAAGDILMGHVDYLQANDPTLSAIYAAAGVKPVSPIQVTPALSWAPPGSLVYGTPLSGTQLNATANVPGTFTYAPAAGTVLAAGTTTLIASFVPTDTVNNSSATASVSLAVTKAAPVVSWSAPASIVAGTALSSAQLNATANVPGSFSYTPATGTILPTGTTALQATFTPTDSTDYATVSSSVNLTITHATQTPSISWTVPASIVYGTALSASQLNAHSTVPGTFTYSPAAGTVPGAGTTLLQATFTPTDSTTYLTASGTASLQITQATPQISWTSPAAITAGTALSATQLNASSSVAGTFTYSPAAGTVPATGTNTLQVTFRPNDAVDYTTQTANVQLTVNAASEAAGPVVILSPASGSAVAGGILVTGRVQVNLDSAGSHLLVDGVPYGRTYFSPFVYPLDTTTLENGQHTLQIWAHDTGNRTVLSPAVSITVQNPGKAVLPVIHWAAPSAITYGTQLSPLQLDATADVAGSFTYSPAAGAVLPAGVHTLEVTFTPADTVSYQTATSSTTLVVGQLTPQITWSAPSAITAGTALSATQLNASANVPGTFVYSPAAGSIPAAGVVMLTAVFTPADPANDTPQQAAVSLTVNAAASPDPGTPVGGPPVVTSPAAPAGPLLIVSPDSGTNVSGTISVAGLCLLPLDAAGTHLLVDGAASGNTQFSPFVYALDTRSLTNGPHTVQLWGHDIGNATTVSPAITINVVN